MLLLHPSRRNTYIIRNRTKYFADVIPGNSIGFVMAVYKPNKQYKRIDVGAGVDIDELLKILEHPEEF